MKINKFAILSIAFSTLFISCDKDEIETGSDYSNGIFVSGEGSGAGTGSVSFIPQDLSTSTDLIYKIENGSELGINLQSMELSDSKIYISVDNQNTITVVDRVTFEEVGSIKSQLLKPRYMEIVGDKGYSTNWGSTADDTDDFIAIIDLGLNTVTSKIPVALGPERILEKNGKLYVSHKGAFGLNNIISVIDIATEVVTEITVGDKPDELFFDANGTLIVLSEGAIEYDESWLPIGHTLASISKIDINTNTVSSTLDFEEGEHPSLLEIDGDDLYYSLNSGVYKLSTSDTYLPETVYIEAGSITGMSINNSRLYTVVADYTALSDLNVYSVTSKEMISTLKVGLGASKIYFNE
jgi:DNA-binding beta-propeller fold protein YncE